MADNEHEHDADDAPVSAPVSDDAATEEAQEEEEAHEHERAQEEPQEAAAPKSEKEIDRALKAVEKAGTSYRNAISRAMGEDAQAMEACPRCNAPVAGMIFPPDVAPVDEETRDAVLASLGIGGGGASPLNAAKGVRECDVCDGWGQLVYPTKVPHTETQACPKCNGTGYVLDAQAQATPIFAVQETNTATTPTAPANPPCPVCGMAGMKNLPHFCNPQTSAGVSGV